MCRDKVCRCSQMNNLNHLNYTTVNFISRVEGMINLKRISPYSSIKPMYPFKQRRLIQRSNRWEILSFYFGSIILNFLIMTPLIQIWNLTNSETNLLNSIVFPESSLSLNKHYWHLVVNNPKKVTWTDWFVQRRRGTPILDWWFQRTGSLSSVGRFYWYGVFQQHS